MALGVLTEKGVSVTSAAVITDDNAGGGLFSLRKSKMNKKMNDLSKFTHKLKTIDELKGRKAIKS